MVKAPSAPYAAGRRGAGWVKVKPRHTLDLVVLAVEWGSGRRQGWLSNIHLGARDPDTGGFVMLGKTFKGMTDEMLAWQTERFTELAVGGTEGHVVTVRPEQVVEIAFDGIQTSLALSRRDGAAVRAGAPISRRQDGRRGGQRCRPCAPCVERLPGSPVRHRLRRGRITTARHEPLWSQDVPRGRRDRGGQHHADATHRTGRHRPPPPLRAPGRCRHLALAVRLRRRVLPDSHLAADLASGGHRGAQPRHLPGTLTGRSAPCLHCIGYLCNLQA